MGVLPIWWPHEVTFDTIFKVDIEWKIPAKETCDIGENTVVSVKNHLCKRALRSRRIQEDRPAWNKYVRVDDDKHIPSVIHRLSFQKIMEILDFRKFSDFISVKMV